MIVFTEGGDSSASYKLFATAKTTEKDDNTHPLWAIDGAGVTKDSDISTPVWGDMRSGDDPDNNLVIPQFRVYAGVAP